MKLFPVLAALAVVSAPLAANAGYRVCPHTGRTYDTSTMTYVDDSYTPSYSSSDDDGDSWDESAYGPRVYQGYNEYLGY